MIAPFMKEQCMTCKRISPCSVLLSCSPLQSFEVSVNNKHDCEVRVSGESLMCRFYTSFPKHTCAKRQGTIRSPKSLACLTKVWPHSRPKEAIAFPGRVAVRHSLCICSGMKGFLHGPRSVSGSSLSLWSTYSTTNTVHKHWMFVLQWAFNKLRRIMSFSSSRLHFRSQVHSVFSLCRGSLALQGLVV